MFTRTLKFWLFASCMKVCWAQCESGFAAVFDMKKDACLSDIRCGYGATPAPENNVDCMKAADKPCGDDLVVRSQPNTTKCTRFLGCDNGQVQKCNDGKLCTATTTTEYSCVSVASASSSNADSDVTIGFTIGHSLYEEDRYKLVIFKDSLPDVLRSVIAAAAAFPVEQVHLDFLSVKDDHMQVAVKLPAGSSPTVSDDDFGKDVERLLLKYQPFTHEEVLYIVGGTLKAANYWKPINENKGNVPSETPIGVEFVQGNDALMHGLIIGFAAMAFIVGVVIVVHNTWKTRKNRVYVCQDEHGNTIGVATSVKELEQVVQEQTAIDVQPEDNRPRFRVYRAIEDYEGQADQNGDHLELHLNFKQNDIIAAYQQEGIMYGYWRGQPTETLQEMRQGYFPSDKVQEVPDVYNHKDEFLWWTEKHEDKEYIFWVCFPPSEQEGLQTESTSTPRSQLCGSWELESPAVTAEELQRIEFHREVSERLETLQRESTADH